MSTSVRVVSCSRYVKSSKKLTLLTHDTLMWLCVSEVKKCISFSENFAHVLSERTLTVIMRNDSPESEVFEINSPLKKNHCPLYTVSYSS